MKNILLFQTYLTIIPYVVIVLYFLGYKRDSFFEKPRSSICFLFAISLLLITLVELVLWELMYKKYHFLNLCITNKGSILLTMVASLAAVTGWVFSGFTQTINSKKTHSMQAIMSSRTCSDFKSASDEITKIQKKIQKKRKKKAYMVFCEKLSFTYSKDAYKGYIPCKIKDYFACIAEAPLTVKEFQNLSDKEKSAFNYMLNFLEYLAIGVRCNNLDEQVVRRSFATIFRNHFNFEQELIKNLFRKKSLTVFSEFEALNLRWESKLKEEKHILLQRTTYLQKTMRILLVLFTLGGFYIFMKAKTGFKAFLKKADKYQC